MIAGCWMNSTPETSANGERKWMSRAVISILLAIGLGWLIWQYADSDELLELLINSSVFYLVVSFFLILLFQYLRALRMCHILGHQASSRSMFSTMCLQFVANGFLPAGLGELALVYLLKQGHEVRYKTGAVVVLSVRLLDVSIFVLGFVLLLAGAWEIVPRAVLMVMLLITVICLLMVAVFVIIMSVNRVPETSSTLLNKLLRFTHSLKDAVALVKSNALGLKVFSYTVAIWVCMYLYFWAIVCALNATMTALQLFWVYILVFPVNILPVKGVANIGTHETAWFISLVLLGYEDTMAANIAFGSHALMLFIILCVGMMVFFMRLYSQFFRPSLR